MSVGLRVSTLLIILVCPFSGRDFIHQMKLIIGVLGTPPKEVLKLSQSDLVSKFIKGAVVSEKRGAFVTQGTQ